MQLALLEPVKLFSSARIDRGPDHLRFALFTISVFWAAGQLFERAAMGSQRDQMRKLLGALGNPEMSPMLQKMVDGSARANSWGWTLVFALFTPVMAFLLIYLNAAVTHGFALLLGQAKRGFPATFAACAYASAPLVLMAVPACGSIVGVLWVVVLTSVGLKSTHRISTGGAAATVLAPYALFCCITLLGGVAMTLAMRNAMGPR